MNNAFEEARHQGFSRADMAQEIAEIEKRMHGLGCDRCLHRDENSLSVRQSSNIQRNSFLVDSVVKERRREHD